MRPRCFGLFFPDDFSFQERKRRQLLQIDDHIAPIWLKWPPGTTEAV